MVIQFNQHRFKVAQRNRRLDPEMSAYS